MKTIVYALVVLALPLTIRGQAASIGRIEQEIVDVERERLRAFAQDDKARFEQLVTEDLTMTHTSGDVANKAQVMAVMRRSTPERPLPSLSIEDASVRVHGDAAVMTGKLVETASDGRRVWVLRFTNTYVKQKGQWRLAAGQLTTLSHERASVRVDPAKLDAYTGQYRNPAGRILNVAREGDNLIAESGGQKVQLFPAAENQFFTKGADVLLVFVHDAQRRVVRLINRRPNGDVVEEEKIR